MKTYYFKTIFSITNRLNFKKFTPLFLILLLSSYTGFSQQTCNQTFSVSGNDGDPTVLSISSADISCNAGGTISNITLDSTTNFSDSNCSNWYEFTLEVDSGTPVTGCRSDFDGTDITGFSSLTITSADTDVFPTDSVTIEVELTVTFTPSACPPPANLLASNITASGADLDWDSEASATSGYDWVIMASGDDPDVDTPVDSANGVTGTSVSSTALSAETDYDAYVRSDCGGSGKSNWSAVESFTTPCVAITSFPYNESFESTSSTLVCWSSSASVGAREWEFGIDTNGAGSINGNDMAFFDDDEAGSGSDNVATLLSPIIDLTTMTNPQLLFDYHLRTISSGESLNVEVWDGAAWQNVLNYTNSDGAWTGSGSQLATINVSTFSNADFQVRFIYDDGPGANFAWYAGIDNFTIEEAPSCITPENLAVSNITSSGADLDWDSEASATSGYDWVIMASGDDPDTDTPVDSANGVTGTSVSSSALSAQTDYDAYVKSDCGGGDKSDWSSAESFKTLCSTESLPWSEDFENAGSTPDCWTESGGEPWDYDTSSGVSFDQVGDSGTITGSTSSGNYFAWIDNSGSDAPSTLTSPFVDLSSLTTPQVAFYVISDSGSDPNATLDVEVYDGSTWTNVGSFSADTNGWERKEIVLSSITFTGDAQVRFTITDEGGFSDDVAIDDVTFEEAPSCITPTGLASSNLTATSVDLDWNSEATATSGYDWAIMASGDDPDTDTPVDSANGVTGTSVSSSALSSNTDYDAYVRSDCGGGDKSDWSTAESFTTLPDFCSGDNFFDNGGPSGNYLDNTNETTVISPDNSGDVVTVTFLSFNTESGFDELKIFDGPDDSATSLGVFNGTTNPGSFTSTHASGALTFVFTSDSGVNRPGWEANVSCAPPPTCITSENLAVSNITSSGADLDWDTEGSATSGYDWVIMASGDDPDVDTPVDSANGVMGTSASSSALSANTGYDAYVRSDCGGGDKSDWSAVESFTTPCVADTFPYSEDFESGSVDSCWTLSNASEISIGNTCSTNATNFLQINGGTHTTETNAIDVSGESSVEVKFDISNGCGNVAEAGETLNIDYWDGSTWQLLESIDPDDIPQDWTTTKSYIVSSGLSADFKLRFDRDGGTTGFDDLSLDNLSVDTPPSCITPENLAVSNITSSGADLDWDSEASASSGYDWVIMASGDDPDVDTPVDSANGVTGTSVTSTALSAETDYDAYVRSDCGGSGKSAWSSAESFTTPADFCAGDLATDSGGENANYPINANETITICPDNPGDKVVINFSEFSFENNGTGCWDGLTIYDGDNTVTASTINPPSGTEWCWDRNDNPPEGSGDLLNVSIAATTASGCITLVMESDGSVTREGFVASASCESTVYMWDGTSWTNDPVLDNITASDNLYVNSGGTPSITSSVSTNDFYVDPSATIDASAGNISVNGDLNNNGSITGSSDVVMSGAAAQSVNGTGSIANLTVNNGNSVSIDGEQDITNMLTLTSGNLSTNGNLTLKSDASGTAQIANLNGNTITGDVTVERFIPAGDNNRRVFRFLSSAVTTSNSIRDNWQEGATSNTDNPNPGFGTHITGSTTDGTNGFDGTNSGAASLLLFDNATQTWSSVGNTDVNTIQAGEAYNLFVRGDRSIDLTSSSQTPTNTVLRATGTVPSGNVDFSSDLSTVADEFNLIGNPYQAIVDYTSLTTTDIKTAFFFVWDSNGATFGNYASYDGSPGEEMMLQPGQSIFVQNSVAATSPSLVFNQSDKNPSGAVTSVFNTNQLAIADLELYNVNNIEVDVMKFRFEDGAYNGIDDFDAGKLGNPTENLASVNSNTLLSIERRDIPQADEILPLFINQYQDTQYEFRIDIANWDNSIDVYIVDNYLNTSTLIDVNQPYSFSVDSSIPESVATDRFEINFDNTTLGVNDNSFGANFSIYPNPTDSGLFTIKTSGLTGEGVDVKIHNMLGQELTSIDFKVENNGEVNVNASELASGIYMVELSQNDKSFTTKLIIK